MQNSFQIHQRIMAMETLNPAFRWMSKSEPIFIACDILKVKRIFSYKNTDLQSLDFRHNFWRSIYH